MTILHRVRANGKGDTKIVKMQRARAIRLHCIECMNFNRLEVDKCTDPLCPLYPYRHTGKPQILIKSESQAEMELSEQPQPTETKNQ